MQDVQAHSLLFFFLLWYSYFNCSLFYTIKIMHSPTEFSSSQVDGDYPMQRQSTGFKKRKELCRLYFGNPFTFQTPVLNKIYNPITGLRQRLSKSERGYIFEKASDSCW